MLSRCRMNRESYDLKQMDAVETPIPDNVNFQGRLDKAYPTL